MLTSSSVRSAALCAALLLPLTSAPNAARIGAFPYPEPRIAFASHRDGNWEIYVMDADGSRQTRLTMRNEQDRFPLWSPDRSKIAFASQVRSGWQLWVMNADGSEPRHLASGISAKAVREWSPDGRRIAFTAMANGDLEVLSVGLDGQPPRALTRSAGDDRDPTWSPDGRLIAFSSARDGRAHVYVMNADGSDVRRLTTATAAEETPVFAPDGSAIAFVSGRDIHTVRPDGSRLRRLTVSAGATRDAVRWSRDASQLAVQVADGTNYDIEILRVADGERRRFAATAAYEGMCTWSPDGKRVAFISARDSLEAAYVADADGGSVRRLTTSATLNPAYAP